VELAARLTSALQELQAVDEYQYVVVNDDLERAVNGVGSIVDAEVMSRTRVKDLRQQVGQLIERLEQEIHNNNP
jgi:guanylate kinase